MSLCFLGICILGTQLVSGGVYSNNLPTQFSKPGYDTVEDLIAGNKNENKIYKIGHLYEDEQINFNVNAVTRLSNKASINWGYDHGIDTLKYDKNPTFTIGATKIIDVSENSYVVINGSTQIGGQERHTSCTDAENNPDFQYSCQTADLVQWKDNTFEPEHENPYNIGVKYVYKFSF